MRDNPWVWTAIFGGLFALSMDFWSWETVQGPGWMGIPHFVWYFLVLQLLLAVALFFFAKFYWTDDEEGGMDT